MTLLESIFSDEGLKLPGRSNPLKFNNSAELGAWLADERTAWSEVFAAGKNNPELPEPLRTALMEPHNKLGHAASLVQNLDSGDAHSRATAQARTNDVLLLLAEGRIPLSTSAAGKRILKAAGEDQNTAAGILLKNGLSKLDVTYHRNNQINTGPIVSAMIDGAILDSDIKRTNASERETTEDLRHKLSEEVRTLINNLKEQARSTESALNTRADKTDSRLNAQQDRFEKAESSLIEWIKKEREKIRDLQDLLKTKLATDDAVDLWQGAATSHLFQAIGAFILFSALGVGGVWAIFSNLDFVISEGHKLQPVNSSSGSFGPGSIALSMILAFPVLALAWLMRLTSRVYVHALNARRDAEIRAALTKTFLNLAADTKNNIETAERILILNALFRPPGATSDDDTMPPNLLETITKARKEGP